MKFMVIYTIGDHSKVGTLLNSDLFRGTPSMYNVLINSYVVSVLPEQILWHDGRAWYGWDL